MREITIDKVRILEPEEKTKAEYIFKGKTNGLLNWNDILYPKFYNVYKQLLSNFWIPDEVSMLNDTKDWENLDDEIKEAFLNISVMLSGLDSIQTQALTDISRYISDTATKHILVNIGQQETIHTESYSYMNASIVSLDEQRRRYNDLLKNEHVIKRNTPITEAYDNFSDNPTPENLLKVLVNSTNLEGIYFVSAFAFFYALDRQNKMKGSATIISYINRDEIVHFDFIGGLIRILMYEYPELNTPENTQYIYDNVSHAVELEKEWANEVIGHLEDKLDIDMDEYEEYIEYIANKRLRIMGLEDLYENVDNAMPWIRAFDEGSLNNTRTDQFEAKPRTYGKVGSDNGFDEL